MLLIPFVPLRMYDDSCDVMTCAIVLCLLLFGYDSRDSYDSHTLLTFLFSPPFAFPLLTNLDLARR